VLGRGQLRLQLKSYPSGVALAVHHRLAGVTTCGLNDLRDNDEHSTYAQKVYGTCCVSSVLLSLQFSAVLCGWICTTSSSSWRWCTTRTPHLMRLWRSDLHIKRQL